MNVMEKSGIKGFGFDHINKDDNIQTNKQMDNKVVLKFGVPV